MQDPLPDAVEPEMTGFDHAGMHGPHCHFMDIVPIHPVIVISARNILGIIIVEHIRFVADVFVIPHHLQPGVTLGTDAILLGHLSFKQMKRFTFQS